MTTSIPLGPFLLVDPLGSGSSGDIWRGRHVASRVDVAIKVLKPALSQRRSYHRRVRSEARAVAALDHPAIIHILDVGVVPPQTEQASNGRIAAGSPWLAMELASGGSLHPFRPLPNWMSLRAMLLALLDALAHAHARGVLHRDIKPGNVLICSSVDQRPGLKLTDWGIAQELNAVDVHRVHAGTRHFMAPEQLAGDWRAFGPWTDLYALGATAWRLSAGRVPFTGLDRAELTEAKLTGEPPPFKPKLDVPPGFVAWVRRLVSRDIGDRYPNAAAAERALRLLPPLERGGPAIFPVNPPTVLVSGVRIPETWRGVTQPKPPRRLIGAGLGVLGLRRVPLVGRNPEQDALYRLLRSALTTSQPRVAILRGPTGTGKSRLANWICERAQELGLATALRARHGPGAGDSLVEMIRRQLRLQRLSPKRRREQLTAAWGPGDDTDAMLALLDPTPAHQQRGDGVRARETTILRYLKRVGPSVLWLDDAHWAPEVLALVQRLAQRDDLPCLIVTTVQIESLTSEVSQQLDALQESGGELIQVGPLPRPHRQSLIHNILPLSPTLAARLEQRTEGNPLFAIQLVTSWVASGQLVGGPSGFDLIGGERALPPSLATVWRERLMDVLPNLSVDAVADLERAAVLGIQVNHEEWNAASDTPDATDQRHYLVETLSQLGLVLTHDGGWSFAHGMLRETVEANARHAGRLKAHHRACARMLDELPASGPRAARRVHHLVVAGRHEAAEAALIDAILSWRHVIGYRACLSLIGELEQVHPPSEQLRVLDVQLLRLMGAYEGAKRSARALLHRATDDAVRNQAWEEIAVVELHLRRLEAGADAAARAAELAEARGDTLRLGNARYLQAAAAGEVRDFDTAQRLLDQASEAFRSAGDEIGEADCQRDAGNFAVQRGALELASQCYQSALEVYRRHRRRLGTAHATNGLAEIARRRGDLATAEAGYREAMALFDDLGAAQAVVPMLNVGMTCLQQGKYRASQATLLRARNQLIGQERLGLLGATHILLLSSLAVDDDWDGWDRAYSEGRSLLDRTGMIDKDIALAAETAAALATAAGKTLRARGAWALARAQYQALGDEAAVNRIEQALRP